MNCKHLVIEKTLTGNLTDNAKAPWKMVSLLCQASIKHCSRFNVQMTQYSLSDQMIIGFKGISHWCQIWSTHKRDFVSYCAEKPHFLEDWLCLNSSHVTKPKMQYPRNKHDKLQASHMHNNLCFINLKQSQDSWCCSHTWSPVKNIFNTTQRPSRF